MLGSDYSELLEGGKLKLYVREGTFYARVYVGERKYLHKSLKTSQLEEARKLATRYFYEIEFKQREKLPLQQRTFSAVIDEYVTLREREYERSTKATVNSSMQEQTSIHMLRQIKRVVKFWHEYCGKTAVDRIDNAVLADYVPWRKDYYHRVPADQLPKNAKLNPADKTLEWEVILAKTILKFAQERGYRGHKPLPTYRFKSERKIVRPAFTLPEYKKLYQRMRKWIYETDNVEWRYTREMMRDYVLILANSGMRVGEANNLKDIDVVEFKDEIGRKNYLFNVKGKTGKRTVIPRTNVVRYVERIRERNEKWKARWEQLALERSKREAEGKQRKNERTKGGIRTANIDKDAGVADWFFRMADGNPIITLIDQFKTLLKLADIEQNSNGEAYTLYSLRHFYAVQMLRRGKVGVFDIARNMGTSVQIIEHYYGKQATPLALATKLGG